MSTPSASSPGQEPRKPSSAALPPARPYAASSASRLLAPTPPPGPSPVESTPTATRTFRPATTTRLRWAESEAPLIERVEALEAEASTLALLLEMTRSLSSEKELDAVLKLIVDQTTLIVNCDRSSVFLLDTEKNELYSLIAQGLDVKELRFSAGRGIAGAVTTGGLGLNIPDAYADPRFNPQVDRDTGYRTRSVLCMPLFSHKGKPLGVIQCLNKKNAENEIVPFTDKDERLLSAVAAQAAVYLENSALRRRMDILFESFVDATSRSIDDRDPCTSGHSRRVMLYALNLARAVHDCQYPPFDEIQYTRERMRQLRYACLLHDVGKIGVREYILCKASKLLPAQMEALRARLTVLKERSRADSLVALLESPEKGAAYLSGTHEPLCTQIDAALALLERLNTQGWLPDAEAKQLLEIHEKGWLQPEEYKNLAVPRGNLTDDEWEDMRSHVTKSYRMLVQIPWPPELKDLPEVAYTHHEKWDGSGYPRKLRAGEIHFDGQIMCVADIYDALTASDRPYKKAIPHERAREILIKEEAEKGRLHEGLVRLFFDAECYRIGQDQPAAGE